MITARALVAAAGLAAAVSVWPLHRAEAAWPDSGGSFAPAVWSLQSRSQEGWACDEAVYGTVATAAHTAVGAGLWSSARWCSPWWSGYVPWSCWSTWDGWWIWCRPSVRVYRPWWSLAWWSCPPPVWCAPTYWPSVYCPPVWRTSWCLSVVHAPVYVVRRYTAPIYCAPVYVPRVVCVPGFSTGFIGWNFGIGLGWSSSGGWSVGVTVGGGGPACGWPASGSVWGSTVPWHHTHWHHARGDAATPLAAPVFVNRTNTTIISSTTNATLTRISNTTINNETAAPVVPSPSARTRGHDGPGAQPPQRGADGGEGRSRDARRDLVRETPPPADASSIDAVSVERGAVDANGVPDSRPRGAPGLERPGDRGSDRAIARAGHREPPRQGPPSRAEIEAARAQARAAADRALEDAKRAALPRDAVSSRGSNEPRRQLVPDRAGRDWRDDQVIAGPGMIPPAGARGAAPATPARRATGGVAPEPAGGRAPGVTLPSRETLTPRPADPDAGSIPVPDRTARTRGAFPGEPTARTPGTGSVLPGVPQPTPRSGRDPASPRGVAVPGTPPGQSPTRERELAPSRVAPSGTIALPPRTAPAQIAPTAPTPPTPSAPAAPAARPRSMPAPAPDPEARLTPSPPSILPPKTDRTGPSLPGAWPEAPVIAPRTTTPRPSGPSITPGLRSPSVLQPSPAGRAQPGLVPSPAPSRSGPSPAALTPGTATPRVKPAQPASTMPAPAMPAPAAPARDPDRPARVAPAPTADPSSAE